MKLNRIFQVALGVALIGMASVQGYAFMIASIDSAAPEAQFDVAQMVEDLRVELTDELACEDKLAKIEAGMHEIDAMLDEGVEDETAFTIAREALVQMRLDLPCLDGEAAVELTGTSGGSQPLLGGALKSLGGGGAGSSSVGGGGVLVAGAAAAVIIPLAVSDDDAPAVVATNAVN